MYTYVGVNHLLYADAHALPVQVHKGKHVFYFPKRHHCS